MELRCSPGHGLRTHRGCHAQSQSRLQSQSLQSQLQSQPLSHSLSQSQGAHLGPSQAQRARSSRPLQVTAGASGGASRGTGRQRQRPTRHAAEHPRQRLPHQRDRRPHPPAAKGSPEAFGSASPSTSDASPSTSAASPSTSKSASTNGCPGPLSINKRASAARPTVSSPTPTRRGTIGPLPASPSSATPPTQTQDFDRDREQNVEESMAALAALGRSLDTLPPDLASAVERGRIPGSIIGRLASLEESRLLTYLLRFGGFRERLLADDLFLTKVAIECGVGICTKTSAELERRRGAFFAEFDFVIADVIMAIIADFMLVWLPAPTVALSNADQKGGGNAVQAWIASCPDNAFQVALRGQEFSPLQRGAAILSNGAKLFAVGTLSSLFGTGLTNGIILLRSSLATLWGPDPEAASAAAAAAAAAAASAAASSVESISESLDVATQAAELAAAASASAVAAAEGLGAAGEAAGVGLEAGASLLPTDALHAALSSPEAAAAAAAAVGTVAEASQVAAAAAASAAAAALVAAAAAAASAAAASGDVAASVEVPIIATSLAYGAYMAISSNLRYQVVAGVVEQRILEPWLYDRKGALSALSFVVRTGNTFLGSLLWVDFARFVGVQ